MKQIMNYIFLVDSGRPRKLYHRSTAGRYRVGAKSKKEAERFMHKAIKFGHIFFYYEDTKQTNAGYKQIIKEYGDGKEIYKTVEF